MSLYMAYVGERIIKPEFRKDFGYLFREEYDKIKSGPIADYVEDWGRVEESRLKPEFDERELFKDFGRLFIKLLDELGREVIYEYVENNYIYPFRYWDVQGLAKALGKPEWDKYKTAYDEETGLFTYGVEYNLHGSWAGSMRDMWDLLEEITEEVISKDGWIEDY